MYNVTVSLFWIVAILVLGGCAFVLEDRSVPSEADQVPDANVSSSTPESVQYFAPITLPAIEGEPFPTTAVATGTPYVNETMGLSFRYPDTWTYVEQEDQRSVIFYPPGTDPQRPGPLIALSFLPDRPYDPDDPLIATGIAGQPVLVGEVEGFHYRDDEYAIPTQSYYIELPHRDGTVFIAATQGPYVNLVPQLEEILTTVMFE